MANEAVKPGLSIPKRFMNPGYPSSMRIIKSWNSEPAGPSLGQELAKSDKTSYRIPE